MFKFDLKAPFQELCIIESFNYQENDFNEYQTESIAGHSLEMATWLQAKSQYFELVTL